MLSRWRGPLAAFVLLATTANAAAHSVALPEEVFCAARSAVIGTVVGAESRDCLLSKHHANYCDRKLRITIRIDSVLMPGDGNLRSGRFVAADARFRNDRPRIISGITIVENGMANGWFGFPATGRPVRTPEAGAVLEGRQFIFGLIPASGNAPPVALAFALGELPWVEATVPRCPQFWR
jgi:hypothetical protein